MAYPSNSPQRWAFDASADTADPGAFADIGFVADDPARYDWLNYTLENHGEWLTYLEDIAPSDGVLRFREWECPDNVAFDVSWSTSVDGRLDATLSVLELTANDATDGAFLSYDALGTSALLQLRGAGATLQSTVAGSVAQVRTANSLGTESARVECDVDTRNIDIISTDGDITIDAGGQIVVSPTVTTSVAREYINVLVPWLSFSKVTTVAATVATTSARPDIVITGLGTAETIGFFDLGQSTRANTSPATEDTIVSVGVEHSVVTGSSGGQLNFQVVTLDPDGTITNVTGGSGSLAFNDSANTLTIGISPETISGAQRLMLRVSCNGTNVGTTISGVFASFASTHLR